MAKKATKKTKDKQRDLPVPVEKREFTPAEQEVVAKYKRRADKVSPPKFEEDNHDNNKIWIKAENAKDGDLLRLAKMTEMTGTVDPDLQSKIFTQVAGSPSKNSASQVSATAALMHGINPQNELEGMLVAQMINAHNNATKLARFAGTSKTMEQLKIYSNMAVKFMNAFTRQLDALQKLRGQAGKQTVRVEHVTVESGGQAIVGHVEGGGGGSKK